MQNLLGFERAGVYTTAWTWGSCVKVMGLSAKGGRTARATSVVTRSSDDGGDDAEETRAR